jgi:hypothetical protein
MKPWLNWALFVMLLVVVIHGIAVNSMMFVTGKRWEAGRQTGNLSQNKNQPSCERFLLGASHHLLPGRHRGRRHEPKRQSEAVHAGLRPGTRSGAGYFRDRSYGAGCERHPRGVLALAIRYGGTARAGESCPRTFIREVC